MAIAPVASAGSNTPGGREYITVDKPTGTVSGHVMLAAIDVVTSSPIVTAPSGWALVRSDTNTATGRITYVYWRAAGASEPSSYQWTQTFASAYEATIATYSGVSTVAPVNISGATVDNTGGSTSVVAPSVTTTVGGALLVGFFAASGGGVLTKPASMTLRRAGTIGHVVADEQLGAAGGTGTRTATAATNTTKDIGVLVALASLNLPPNAPTLTSPVGGAAIDRAVSLDLDGTFSDPDPGDQLSQTEVERRSGGVTTNMGTVAASGSTFTRTIAGGTLAAGAWEWRARTWDALGDVGPWSAWASFVALDQPAAPVITAPTDGGTIPTTPYTVEWTAPFQTAYQVRRTDDEVPTTIYADTGTVTSTVRSASVSFPTQRVEFVQVRVQYAGLWSPWDSNDATVSYTPPSSPTTAAAPYLVVIDGVPVDAAIAVTIDNPGGGSTVNYNEVWRSQRRSVDDDWSDPIRRVTNVAADGTWTDWATEHRMEYRYRTVAVGTNTSETTGAWST